MVLELLQGHVAQVPCLSGVREPGADHEGGDRQTDNCIKHSDRQIEKENYITQSQTDNCIKHSDRQTKRII